MPTAALIATGDPKIVDDLLRLAAAANAEAEVARSLEHVRTAWHRVPLVLVGADVAPTIAAARLTRRSGVVLVTVADTSVGHHEANDYRPAALHSETTGHAAAHHRTADTRPELEGHQPDDRHPELGGRRTGEGARQLAEPHSPHNHRSAITPRTVNSHLKPEVNHRSDRPTSEDGHRRGAAHLSADLFRGEPRNPRQTSCHEVAPSGPTNPHPGAKGDRTSEAHRKAETHGTPGRPRSGDGSHDGKAHREADRFRAEAGDRTGDAHAVVPYSAANVHRASALPCGTEGDRTAEGNRVAAYCGADGPRSGDGHREGEGAGASLGGKCGDRSTDAHRVVVPDGADDARSRGGYRGVEGYQGVGAVDSYRVAVEIGAQDVAVLPDDEAWLVDALAAAAEPHDGRATTICVAGGRGGAGASVLAAVLGLVGSRRGLRTLLVDGDPLGGGIDLVLGQEEIPGARWPELAERRGRLSAAMLRKSLPGVGDLTVLSWHRGDAEPVAAEAMDSVLGAAARGFDLVVVDVARQPGEAGRAALRTAHSTLLVVPAELRATAAADRVAAALRADTEDLRLVVRGPAPGGLSGEVIAEALDLPLAGFVMNDRRLPVALEQGDLVRVSRRGPLTDFCNRLITDLGLHPAAVRDEAA